MSHQILGISALPAVDPRQQRRRGDPQNRSQVCAHELNQSRLIAPHQILAAWTADEAPDQRIIGGGTMCELGRGPGGGHDAVAFALPYQEAEAVELMRAIAASTGERNRRGPAVRNGT